MYAFGLVLNNSEVLFFLIYLYTISFSPLLFVAFSSNTTTLVDKETEKKRYKDKYKREWKFNPNGINVLVVSIETMFQFKKEKKK